MATSGIKSYVNYGWETTYGTASSTINIPFGHDTKITSLSMKRNSKMINGLGNTEAVNSVATTFEGSLGIDFVLGNGYLFKAVTGNTSTDAGSGPYTHTYIASAGDMGKTLPSFTVENGVDLSTDYRGKYTGCTINSLKLSASTGELVQASATIDFAKFEKDATLGTKVDDTYADPFSFVHASLEIPDGTTIAEVQSFDLTINKKPKLVDGLGSQFHQTAITTGTEYDLSVDVAFEDTVLMEDFLGSSSSPADNPDEVASLDINFNNGKSGTDLRSLQITFSGIRLDELSLPQDNEDLIKESLTIKPRQISSLVYTDNNATSL